MIEKGKAAIKNRIFFTRLLGPATSWIYQIVLRIPVTRNDAIITDDVSANSKILSWSLYSIASKISVTTSTTKSIRETGVPMHCRAVNGYSWLLSVISSWNSVSSIAFSSRLPIAFPNKTRPSSSVYTCQYV